MAINFLDKTGLTHFWQVIKSKFIGFENLNQSGPNGTEYTLEWIRDPNTDNRYYIPQGTYSKPNEGIPESDLASTVKNKLHSVTKDPEDHIYRIDGNEIAAKYDDDLNDISQTYATNTVVTNLSNDVGTINQKISSAASSTNKLVSASEMNNAIETKVSGYDSHIANTTIHVTTEDKTAWNNKYSKPSGGIPSSDMAMSVRESLAKADFSYQKPSSGIPASDLAAGVIPDVENATEVTISTNISALSADTEIPSAKAVYTLFSSIQNGNGVLY